MTNKIVFTETGDIVAMNRFLKNSPDYGEPNKFRIGRNNVPITVQDTSLTHPVPITGVTEMDDCDSTSGWTAGTDGSVSINTTYVKEGTGSLNLIKTGETQTEVVYSVAFTVFDATDNKAYVWIRFTDQASINKLSSADGVEYRFGDTSTDYYYIQVASADLIVGWNVIELDVTTASSTGSPTVTTIDYAAIRLKFTAITDTLAEGDCQVDYLFSADEDSYESGFESDSPEISEADREAVIRMRLTPLDAVTFDLDSLTLKNTNNQAIVLAEYDDFSKDINDEIIFVVRLGR